MKKEIPLRLDKIIHDYAKGLRDVYGDKLMCVTLFGSYARGDFTEGSDIDILVVVDLPKEGLDDYREKVVDFTFETNLEYDVEIEPVIWNYERYRYWEAVHPLLNEIRKDGVNLYAA